MTDLDALDAAYAQMTPPPWRQEYDASITHAHDTDLRADTWEGDTCVGTTDSRNAAGIVALVNAYPVLAAEVRRLRAENATDLNLSHKGKYLTSEQQWLVLEAAFRAGYVAGETEAADACGMNPDYLIDEAAADEALAHWQQRAAQKAGT